MGGGGGASNAWFPPLSPLCRYNVPSFSEQRLVIKSSNDKDFEKPFTRIYLLCTCSDLSLYGQKRVQNEKICQLSFLKKYHAVFSKGKLELCRYLFKVVSKLLAAKLRTWGSHSDKTPTPGLDFRRPLESGVPFLFCSHLRSKIQLWFQ